MYHGETFCLFQVLILMEHIGKKMGAAYAFYGLFHCFDDFEDICVDVIRGGFDDDPFTTIHIIFLSSRVVSGRPETK